MRKIFSFIKNLFNSSGSYVKKFIEPSIMVVEKIKGFLSSQAMNFILEVIPGNIDNQIAAKINIALPRILLYLRLANECKELDSKEKILECALNALQKTDPKARHAFYLSIASMLAADLSDGKLSWSEAVILAQYTYSERFKVV